MVLEDLTAPEGLTAREVLQTSTKNDARMFNRFGAVAKEGNVYCLTIKMKVKNRHYLATLYKYKLLSLAVMDHVQKQSNC